MVKYVIITIKYVKWNVVFIFLNHLISQVGSYGIFILPWYEC